MFFKTQSVPILRQKGKGNTWHIGANRKSYSKNYFRHGTMEKVQKWKSSKYRTKFTLIIFKFYVMLKSGSRITIIGFVNCSVKHAV